MEKNLTTIIHNQMKKQGLEEAKKHDPCKFYPSSVGKCLRCIVYQMQGYGKKEWEGKMLLIVENGTYFHNRIENIMKGTDLLIAPETSIRIPELRISGRTDMIIENFLDHKPSDNIIRLFKEEKIEPKEGQTEEECIIREQIYEGPDNNVIIVELKSINDSGFSYISRTGPKEGHIMQLQLYLHITGVKQGMLFYENKNNQEIKEFLIEYDPFMGEQIMNKVKAANKHVNENTLPPKEFERNDFECRYCDYKDLCWPVQNKVSIADII